MKIFISILVILFLIVFTSKIKVNVISSKKSTKGSKINFKINLGIYLFGIIKIFGINFKQDGVYLLFFSLPYSKMKLNQNGLQILKKYSILDSAKVLDLKIDNLFLDLKIGSEELPLTIFSVFAISTFISIFLAKHSKSSKRKKYYYKITPMYNQDFLEFEFSSRISLKLINFVKNLTSTNKKKKQNLRSYEKLEYSA